MLISFVGFKLPNTLYYLHKLLECYCPMLFAYVYWHRFILTWKNYQFIFHNLNSVKMNGLPQKEEERRTDQKIFAITVG